MKTVLTFILIFICFYSNSQSGLPPVFPQGSTVHFNDSATVVPSNMLVRLSSGGDSLFFNARFDYLEGYFNTVNDDSLAALVDTIVYRYNYGLIYDTTNNIIVDTLVQKIGFYWSKNITFNEANITSSATLYTDGNASNERSNPCYVTTYKKGLFAPHSICHTLIICKNNGTSCGTTAYTKVFEDNFDGDKLDEKRWFIQTGGYSGYGTGYFMRKNVEVSSGTLKLKAANEGNVPIYDSDGSFENSTGLTSSQINTLAHFGYGKYEIRAKVPQCYGNNPAYWIIGSDLEIDGFEFFTTNQADMPQMTIYSTTGLVNLLPHSMCEGSGASNPNVRVSQTTAKQDYDVGGNKIWTNLPDLHTSFHTYTLIWDPNYITWSIDDAWFLTAYKKYSDLTDSPNPAENCNVPSSNTYEFGQFPSFNGNVQFDLSHGVFPSKSLTGAPEQVGPAPNTTAIFEIDWVKIYQVDNCGSNVNIPSEHPFNYLNHNNQNDLTGDIVTLGGGGSSNPFHVDYNTYYTNPNNINLFVRANNEVQLKDGVIIDTGTVFEASIAYDGRDLGPGYNPSSGPSDCNNTNSYYTQYVRTSGNEPAPIGNSSFNNAASSVKSISNLNDDLTKLRVYPNPAQNELFISGVSNYQQLEVLDATMQSIKNIKRAQTMIDIKDLPSGLYFLRISWNNKVITTKFIKQ